MARHLVVVGVGNLWRGDDGVGLMAARALAAQDLPGVTVLECADVGPELLDLWADADLAILIDAVLSGASPGALHRIDATESSLPGEMRACSTHTLDLSAIIELGRRLGRLPRRLVVYGVEARTLSQGTGLSVEAQAGLETCINAATRELLDNSAICPAASPD